MKDVKNLPRRDQKTFAWRRAAPADFGAVNTRSSRTHDAAVPAAVAA